MTMPPLIRSVRYDEGKRVLTVQFQVGAYEYHDVPKDVANSMAHPEERMDGTVHWFNTRIEGKYKSARIGP